MNHLSRIVAVFFFCSFVCTMLNAEDEFDNSPLDPTIPIHPVGFYNGSPGAWFMYGELLCISVNNGIEFWEKVDETKSQVVSRIEDTGLVRTFIRNEKTIYGLTVDGEIVVISVESPAAPDLTAKLEGVPSHYFGHWTLTMFHISDHYLVISDRNNFAQQFTSVPLRVYDITDPKHPKIPNALDWEGTKYDLGYLQGFIEVLGNEERIYDTEEDGDLTHARFNLMKESRNGARHVMSSSAHEPFELVFEDDACTVISGNSGEKVLWDRLLPVSGERFFFSYSGTNHESEMGFTTVMHLSSEGEIRDLGAPVLPEVSYDSKKLPIPAPAPIIESADQLIGLNDMLLVFSANDSVLYQLDISNPSQPKLISEITAYGVSANGDYVWVDSGDIMEAYKSEGTAPILRIARILKPNGFVSGSIYPDGEIMCIQCGDGLRFYQITGSSESRILQRVEKSWTQHVQYGLYVFGRSGDYVEMLDVSDLGRLIDLGRLDSVGDLHLTKSVLAVFSSPYEAPTFFDVSRMPQIIQIPDSDGTTEEGLIEIRSGCASRSHIYKGSSFHYSDGVLIGIHRFPIGFSAAPIKAEMILEGAYGPYDTHNYYFPESMAVVNDHLWIGTDGKGLTVIPLNENK